MAQAEAELDSVDAGQVEHDHGSEAPYCEAPYMPHLALAQEELDRLHPSLVPPDDEQLDDLVSDERDAVYQKGMQLAEEIRSETSLQGRMRRPLLARLEEQQQHNRSSSRSRTRTIRPFGGGVVSGATTSVLLPLPGTIRTTTTTTTYDTTAAVVDGTADEVVAMITAYGDEDGDARMSGCKCDSPRTSVIHFGSCKPFASSACAHR